MSSPQASAPQWFLDALNHKPEEGRLTVEGASLEWAVWGERGRQGSLLLIGNGANIGWWRPIAPILAQDYRVATFAWSGMGSSDWRDTYPMETLISEAMGVAEHTGIFEGADKPFMAAHSLGGFIGLQALRAHAKRFAGAVMIDSRLRTRSTWGPNATPVPAFHIHPTREQAISRFGLKPVQPQQNQFILDMLAAEALEQVEGGWRWKADPDLRKKTPLASDLIPLLSAIECPLAFVRGEHTTSVTEEVGGEQKAAAPCGALFVVIPDAHHHVMIDQPVALVSVMRALFGAIAKDVSWKL